jgi:protein-L-isoaspartate(D-aspartate) O-methyltransferase
LIFPWRPTADVALAMLVTRVTEGFAARPLMSSWFIPCSGASSHKGNSLAPNPSTVRRIQSLHLTRVRAPDESAIAIYEQCWFSSAKVSA